ncbi:hypothetical protein ACFVZH_39315 [Streptomyces sp. NPDC059534]|uniref:hypothetical protein n=1 Tax=Streptomyces sp. NPDC059534 TaxID=3346859 RepID=UPI0036C4FE0A
MLLFRFLTQLSDSTDVSVVEAVRTLQHEGDYAVGADFVGDDPVPDVNDPDPRDLDLDADVVAEHPGSEPGVGVVDDLDLRDLQGPGAAGEFGAAAVGE